LYFGEPFCELAGNIGFTGEAFIVEFITESMGMQELRISISS
jgi:hypothetical protein